MEIGSVLASSMAVLVALVVLALVIAVTLWLVGRSLVGDPPRTP